MDDVIQEAREAAWDARLSHDAEPDWRRVRWSVERYLQATRRIRAHIKGWRNGLVSTEEVKQQVEAIKCSLGKARSCVLEFLNACLTEASTPKCLADFDKGLKRLHFFCGENDLKWLDWADECFMWTEDEFAELLKELEEVDNGDFGAGGGGAGCPSPMSPGPRLSGKDARPYPPTEEDD